jgi:hypothetical protein
VAATDLAASIATVQVVSATVSQPLQPTNVDVEAGVAASVTSAPLRKDAAQVAPQ